MKWRDVFIGSIATPIVTVVGGVILYYLTREPPQPPPAERLVYDIDWPVVFESDQTTLSFVNVRIKNTGDESATNVVVGIEFGDKVKITDKRVSLSSGPAGKIAATTTGDNALEVQMAVLTPNETATVAVLTDTADDKAPRVGVKSDSSTGKERSLTSVIRIPSSRTTNEADTVAIVILVALLAQIVLLVFMRPRFFGILSRLIPNPRSANNTAFVFLRRPTFTTK